MTRNKFRGSEHHPLTFTTEDQRTTPLSQLQGLMLYVLCSTRCFQSEQREPEQYKLRTIRLYDVERFAFVGTNVS